MTRDSDSFINKVEVSVESHRLRTIMRLTSDHECTVSESESTVLSGLSEVHTSACVADRPQGAARGGGGSSGRSSLVRANIAG